MLPTYVTYVLQKAIDLARKSDVAPCRAAPFTKTPATREQLRCLKRSKV